MSEHINRFNYNQFKKESHEGYINKKNNDSKQQNKENYKYNENNKVFISFKRLKEIESKDDNEIILFFQKYDNISQVFENTKFSEEMVYLMVDILTRISFVNSSPASIILYQIIENTSFFEKIKDCLNNINTNNYNYLKFVFNLIKLSDKILDKFSKSNKRIKRGDFLDLEDLLIDKISQNAKEEKNENDILIEKILEKIKQYKEREKHINIIKIKENEEKLNNKNINNRDKITIDYKNADVLIKKEEFEQNNDKIISHHIKSGPYFSYERYINTNFYLEREDCYRDLRKAIKFIQSQGKSINDMDYKEIKDLTKQFSNLYFYIKGEINYLEMNSNGMIITMDFQGINSKKIKFTKRMITGSLVVLSDRNFSDYLLTTVFYNPYFDKKSNEKNNQNNKKLKIKIPDHPYYRVQLSLININQNSLSFLKNNLKDLQIFESKAYFESYIHIMKRLQQINVKDLPFKSELIDANFSDIKITQPEKGYKYNNLIINPDKNEFPDEFKNLLDESQLKALKMTLNNKISLIQGPPGTGKTHFGALITNLLLQNLDDKNNDDYKGENDVEYMDENNNENSNPPQILVVCYTNHALDQFIEKVSKYTDSIIRIGGRCQNENVKKYELRNKIHSFPNKNIIDKLNSIGSNMKGIISLIDIRKRVSGSLVEDKFKELYNKIINDFLSIIKNSIPYKYHKKLLNIDDDLKKNIFIFWNMIGSQNNSPDEIINVLLDNLKISREKERNQLFERIHNELIGLDKDNIEILKYINNTNESRDNNINIIEEDKLEEQEECDEDEIIENEDKLKYRDDIENNEEIEEEEESQELLDENDSDFKKLKPLNKEKYEFLINSINNIFELGPKIIKLLIDYMKHELLKEESNHEFDLTKFKELLEKKTKFL